MRRVLSQKKKKNLNLNLNRNPRDAATGYNVDTLYYILTRTGETRVRVLCNIVRASETLEAVQRARFVAPFVYNLSCHLLRAQTGVRNDDNA